jgi:hypothetical protein
MEDEKVSSSAVDEHEAFCAFRSPCRTSPRSSIRRRILHGSLCARARALVPLSTRQWRKPITRLINLGVSPVSFKNLGV